MFALCERAHLSKSELHEEMLLTSLWVLEAWWVAPSARVLAQPSLRSPPCQGALAASAITAQTTTFNPNFLLCGLHVFLLACCELRVCSQHLLKARQCFCPIYPRRIGQVQSKASSA
jgi:hypothetical protein